MKYANIQDGKIQSISYQAIEGWVQIPDYVFADWEIQPDGSFTPPPQEPELVPTTAERLTQLGISIEELRALLQ